MKRFILAIALVAGTAGISAAQSSASASTEVSAPAQERLQFISYMNELDAGLSRNNQPMVSAAITKLQEAMQTHIAATAQQGGWKSADAASKAEFSNRAKTQSEIASEVKVLSVNPAANREALKTKLQEFLKNF